MLIPQRSNVYRGSAYRQDEKEIKKELKLAQTVHLARWDNNANCGVSTGTTTKVEEEITCKECKKFIEKMKKEKIRAEECFKLLQENDSEKLRNKIIKSIDCCHRQIWLDAFEYDYDNDMKEKIKDVTHS
ncbi:MAG: hypothetical protein M0P71_00960 [Melioribacteraceae bacterium]|nr:hypothetical protein [Melioribacteraceae bacterium]